MTNEERAEHVLIDALGGTRAQALRRAIVDQLEEAKADMRERAAQVAEEAARRNATCPHGCKCGDGFHVAAMIRGLEVYE